MRCRAGVPSRPGAGRHAAARGGPHRPEKVRQRCSTARCGLTVLHCTVLGDGGVVSSAVVIGPRLELWTDLPRPRPPVINCSALQACRHFYNIAAEDWIHNKAWMLVV